MADKKIDDKPKTDPYVCTSCGLRKDRASLTAKKVMFKLLGRNGKVLRSRVSAWLCESCLSKDADWTREESKGIGPKPPTKADK